MTAISPAATVELPEAAPRRKSRRIRARFPLVLKLFLLTAGLIALVAGIAIGITVQRADSIAETSVNAAISGAGNLFKDLERRRLKELSLGALTVSRDATFHAYIEDALNPQAAEPAAPTAGQAPPATPADATAAPAEPPPVDVASILNQLQQRRDLLGVDLIIFTDDQGITVARTDRAELTQRMSEDLYEEQPLLQKFIDEPPPVDPVTEAVTPVTGTILTGGRLYHAAIAQQSVGAGRPPIGYLIAAYAIDDRFANQIAKATNTGVLFVPVRSPQSTALTTPRSSNAPSADRLTAMPQIRTLLASGKMLPAQKVTIDRSAYVMTGEPLSSTGQPTGAAVFVRSLDSELAPFRAIERTLFIAGGIALLIAFLLSWLIAKRVTRPIEDLAGMAQAVTEGDYSVRPDVKRSDEVGLLASSFASMITALRDKAEIEELYEQMATRVRERESAVAVPQLQAAKSEEGTILVTDLRGLATSEGEGRPEDVIARVSEAMRVQEAEVRRQDGRVREVVGYRLVSVFTGERAIIHAVRAARAISEELDLRTRNDRPLSIGAGIATGEFVSGSVEVSGESGLAMVGNAPLLALMFAWEAPAGVAFISMETVQAAGPDVMAHAKREEVKLRWLATPLPAMALPLHSLTTGVMQTMGATGQMATVRLGGTEPHGGPTKELRPGTLFASRYEIEQVLGRGGMGVVYRAVDRQLDEPVAIKTLIGDMLMNSPEQLERFKREIRLARKITHRNVLRTFDYGEADGMHFISMEYVRGYALSDLIDQSGQMAPRVALGVTRQICRGLQAAHEQGIIHRDIKPQNVLIDHRGEVKLMDFGIARMAEAPEAMTAAGLIVGTPHYMSPEQVQGKTLDPRSDVYAMGIMLYEMLAGRRPFDASSVMALLTAHITEKPQPLSAVRPDVGRDLDAVVMRCLAKEPKERYADAGELLRALDALNTGTSTAAAA